MLIAKNHCIKTEYENTKRATESWVDLQIREELEGLLLWYWENTLLRKHFIEETHTCFLVGIQWQACHLVVSSSFATLTCWTGYSCASLVVRHKWLLDWIKWLSQMIMSNDWVKWLSQIPKVYFTIIDYIIA